MRRVFLFHIGCFQAEGKAAIPYLIEVVPPAENDFVRVDFYDHGATAVEYAVVVEKHEAGEIDAVDVTHFFKGGVGLLFGEAHVRVPAEKDNVIILLQNGVDLIRFGTETARHVVVFFIAESLGQAVRLIEGEMADDENGLVGRKRRKLFIQPSDLFVADACANAGAFAAHA